MHVFDANGDIIQPTKLVHKNRSTAESRLQQVFDLMMDPHRTSAGFYLRAHGSPTKGNDNAEHELPG